jgi:hypothetical protein
MDGEREAGRRGRYKNPGPGITARPPPLRAYTINQSTSLAPKKRESKNHLPFNSKPHSKPNHRSAPDSSVT